MKDSKRHAWLVEQIIIRYGDGDLLIQASKKHGNQRYYWLLDRLTERCATDLVDEFREKCRAERVANDWDLKRRNLATIEENLAYRRASNQKLGSPDDSYSLHLQTAANKLRKAIEKHELQQQEEEEHERSHP